MTNPQTDLVATPERSGQASPSALEQRQAVRLDVRRHLRQNQDARLVAGPEAISGPPGMTEAIAPSAMA